MNKLVDTSGKELAPAPSGDLITALERASRDPNVDPAKLSALLDVYERVETRNAVVAFNTAMAEMQPQLPTIQKNGAIKYKDRETPYALFEDIQKAIREIAEAHGFSFRFETGRTDNADVIVTCIVAHAAGHETHTTLQGPVDNTGAKNAVQAIGSTTKYLMRYTLCAALNIIIEGEDDDAQLGGGEPTNREPIERGERMKSKEQVYAELEEALAECSTLTRLESIKRIYNRDWRERFKSKEDLWNGGIDEMFAQKEEEIMRNNEAMEAEKALL